MPLIETPLQARTTNVEQDSVMAILTQDAISTNSTPTGLTTNGDVGFGKEFVLCARLGIAADSPAGATNYDALFFNKNAPFKFLVTQVTITTIDVTAGDYTAADAGDLKFELAHGDGEASETFTNIFSLNLDENVPANNLGLTIPASATHTMDQAQTIIAAGDSLRARVILDPDATAAGTNDGGEFLWVIRCVRVK